MRTAGARHVIVLGSGLLGACAHLEQRRFDEFLARFRSDPAFQAAAVGPRVWVTETTVWQGPDGYDSRVSCSAVRPVSWLQGRGYRLVPTPVDAAREGLGITTRRSSAATVEVEVGAPRSEPQVIYSFYREDGAWQLAGMEVLRREQPADGEVPAYSCLATER